MSPSTSRKRKAHVDDEFASAHWEDEPRKSRKRNNTPKEKRLRRFRANAPKNFNVLFERATQQRFYVLSRSRCGSDFCPEEKIEVTGSTGNIYTVHIGELPSCTCPHAIKGNQCKHVIYVTSRVLRARQDLVYQLAFVPSELREIFENAPPIDVNDKSKGKNSDPNRKALDGDCPICFMPFDDSAEEDTVYCRATCGQNIHRECFEMWAATKRRTSSHGVTCPMCRSKWQGDEDMVKNIRQMAVLGDEGYLNVAEQLRLSHVRDQSTYYGRFVGLRHFPPVHYGSEPW